VDDGRRDGSLEGRMADMPIDPGFAPPRFANVESELDLAADRKLVKEGEVADFPVDPLPVLPALQQSFSVDCWIAGSPLATGLQTARYI